MVVMARAMANRFWLRSFKSEPEPLENILVRPFLEI